MFYLIGRFGIEYFSPLPCFFYGAGVKCSREPEEEEEEEEEAT